MTQSVSEKRYLLYLINPRQKYKNYSIQSELCKMLGKKSFMSPLSLPTIAAITPSNYDIRIFDEELEPLPLNDSPDLVGITTLAATSGRAYEISAKFRERNIPVIFGGPHASYCVDESLEHADSVVIGEAEKTWEKCLSDFENGNLQKTYHSADYAEYNIKPLPRWDLVKTDRIMTMGVQATRGCPFKCEFCLVSSLLGRKMRLRDVDNIVEEIKANPIKNIFFVDDNLTINKRFATELFEKLTPLKISWSCQSSIEIGHDKELLEAMIKSGCINILVGFESVNPDSLVETKKDQNQIEQYEIAIRNIQDAGIQVIGSFVVGFDNDTLDEFENIYQFTLKNNIPHVNLNILGVPAGTELHSRLKKDGRLYDSPAELRSGLFPCIHYNKIGQVELFEKYLETTLRLFSSDTLYDKGIELFGRGYYNKPFNDEKGGFFFKFRISMKILGIYYFTSDKTKRKLFKGLFRLMRQEKLAVDRMISFLLSMEGFGRHMRKIDDNKEFFIEQLKKHDKGSWEDQLKTMV